MTTEVRPSSTMKRGKAKVEFIEPPENSASATFEDYSALVSDDDDHWRAGSFTEGEKFVPIAEGLCRNDSCRDSSDPDARLVDGWVDQVWNKIDTARRSSSSQGLAPCTIYEVPANMQKQDAQAYQPRLVAIGPYHRGKPGLPVMDDDKFRCVRHLLYLGAPRVSMDELLRCWIENIKQKEELARSCYSRAIDMDSYSFVEMLLLDGCFILHVLLMAVNDLRIVAEEGSGDEDVEAAVAARRPKEDDGGSPLVGMLWQWKLLKLDLLLLENQIPFFVIQDLFDRMKTPDTVHISVAHLALQLFDELYPGMHRHFFECVPSHGPGILHLLQLFHSALVPSDNYRMTDTHSWDPWAPSSFTTIAQVQVPSAAELRESAVQFRRKDSARSFLDIAFRNGELEIPTLRISDCSNALFRNLIAFEQCYSGVSPYITAYATFMECIMHSQKDVRLLHLSGAVVNRLSTDEDVAVFFKQICYQVDHPHIPHYLSPLCEKVADHHRSYWCRWNAELRRRYFSNPWVALSVLAAISLLCLNFIQTFYTVLGYYHHK